MLVPLSVPSRQDVSLFVNGQVLPEEKQYSDNHSHSIEDDEERKNTPSIGFDPSSVRLHHHEIQQRNALTASSYIQR